MGKFGETRGGVGKSGVLEHKSSNISETGKDRGKVTMEGLNCISSRHAYLRSLRRVKSDVIKIDTKNRCKRSLSRTFNISNFRMGRAKI